MKVHIGPIKGRKGASISVRFQEVEPDSPDESLTFAPGTPLVVEAKVTNTGRCYLVQGNIDADVLLECSRCLRTYREALTVPLHETFCPREEGKRELHEDRTAFEDVDEDEWSGDERVFTGAEFDLTDVVWEQLILSLPMKLLCKEDCAGICPHCGADRNERPCDCEDRSVDPRLAVLAQWGTTAASEDEATGPNSRQE